MLRRFGPILGVTSAALLAGCQAARTSEPPEGARAAATDRPHAARNACVSHVLDEFDALPSSPSRVITLEDTASALARTLAEHKTYTCDGVSDHDCHGHLQGIARLAGSASFILAGTSDLRNETLQQPNLHVFDDRGRLLDNLIDLSSAGGDTHVDGIQAVGDYVFVPVWDALVFKIDPRDPNAGREPKPQATVRMSRHLYEIDGVAVAKLASGDYAGRYAIAVGSDELWKVSLFLSATDDPDRSRDWGFELVPRADGLSYSWSIPDRYNYQAINFVDECETGRLYLFGFYRDGNGDRSAFGDGADSVDLFEVGPLVRGWDGSPQVPSLTFVRARKFTPANSDFSGAAGAYASADGRLTLYSTTKRRKTSMAPLVIEEFSRP